MTKFKIIPFLFLLFSLNTFASEIVFKLDNKKIASLNDKEIRSGRLKVKGNMISSLDKTLYNPWREYERTYRSYSLLEILDAIYGVEWKKMATIKFTALDGYKQTAKISAMLKHKNKQGFVSYTETGKSGFTPFKRKEKIIDPGPYYIVWSGFTREEKASHGDDLKWPYQLSEIEIISELD